MRVRNLPCLRSRAAGLRLRGAFAALLIACLLAPGTARAATAGEPREKEAAAIFTEAEELAIKGSAGAAVAKFRTIVNRYRETSVAPKAQFRIAQLYERNRENERAFENYQILIDHFPASDLFTEAVKAELRIANRVMDAYALRERKGRDHTPEPLKDPEKASRMLRIILENGPHTDWAPDTHYRLAIALEKEGWPRTAAEEHEAIVENYPTHHRADDAAFQAAYINYKLCVEKGAESRYRTRAQLAFQYFLQVYPGSEKIPRARHLLRELDSLEFNDLVSAGKFYEANGDLRAALIYYEDAEKRFPSDVATIEWLPARLKDLRGSNVEPAADKAEPAR